MKNYLRLIGSAFFAGVLIGIASLLYMKLENKIVGAVMFSVGLVGVILLGVDLFTGKIGYAKKGDVGRLIVMLLSNLVGAFAVGLFTHSDIIEKKIESPLWAVFINAIICGILIYIAVEGYRRSKQVIAIMLPVAAFVMMGAEHCVADAAYLAAGWNISPKMLLFLLVVVAGNTVGGLLSHHLCTHCLLKEKKNE